MNKYELALVVSAKVEDEVRDAVVEKAKGYIARYNGNVTEVEEWGKKKLAYEIQKMHEGFYYFIQFEADAQCPAEIFPSGNPYCSQRSYSDRQLHKQRRSESLYDRSCR